MSGMSSRRSRSARQLHRDDVDAVVKVLAEPPFGHQLRQILVGRRHDADVRLDLFEPADAPEAPLLQHAQQLHLHHRRHLADLVEENRAALRDFDQALLGRLGAGERAAHVTEQLGLEQRFRQRAAVERDERHARAAASGSAARGRRAPSPCPIRRSRAQCSWSWPQIPRGRRRPACWRCGR